MTKGTLGLALLVTAVVASGGLAVALVWVATLDDSLRCEERAFDAGVRPPGGTVSHKFSVVSRSLWPVRIVSVTPACSCNAEAKAEPLEVTAMGGTEVTVRWQLPREPGPTETQVVVTYRGEDGQRTISLSLSCVVSTPDTAKK